MTTEEIADDADFAACLATYKYMKANFTYHPRPELYLFESLALCQRTSEKQSASALDLASVFAEAVRLRRAVMGQKSLRDVLQACVTDYNKAVGKVPLHIPQVNVCVCVCVCVSVCVALTAC